MDTITASDLFAAESRQQQACALGDYAVFGAALNVISELLCEVTGVNYVQPFM